MTNPPPRFIINFIADTGEEWQEDEAQYIPRVGDIRYPYEGVKGVFMVEEVWEIGEGNGRVTQGTNVFVRRIAMEGSRLHSVDPSYYVN